jgi:hypothetical protein
MIDKILDTAGQKGTGKWTAISALDLGMPVTLIGESVFARCLSALKDERVKASKVLNGPAKAKTVAEKKEFIEDVRRALYCSKMISYAQGYMLLRAAEKDQGWHLNMGGIALMWRGGCIIRSASWATSRRRTTRIRSCEPAAGRLLLERAEQVPGKLAQGAHPCDRDRRADAGVLDRAGVLRRLPHGAAAGEPAAGAARLLRRAHLRARRQAARRVLPHQLDRTRRTRLVDHLQRLGTRVCLPRPEWSHILILRCK